MTRRFPVQAEIWLGAAGWVDITSDLRGPVRIKRVIPAGRRVADTGTCAFRLDNASGDYSRRDPAGAHYGYLTRNNTPFRFGLPRAADTFGTAAAASWGASWPTQSGGLAADYSVSGGLARHAQSTKNVVRFSLRAESWRDVEQVTAASIPAVAVGASVVVGHVARYDPGTGHCYWLRLEFDAAGAITAKISKFAGAWVEIAARSAIPGLTYTAGQAYALRSSVYGDRLAVKVWPAGTPEPLAWTLTGVDRSITAAGRAGLASWVVAGNTNTNEVRFDEYAAVWRRFTGEVASWPAGWDHRGRIRHVDVEASGILRRFGQGEQPTLSPLRRLIGTAQPEPMAYWPGEDGAASRWLASAVSGQAPMIVTGTPEFVPVREYKSLYHTSRYGSAALVNLASGARLAGTVSAAAVAAMDAAGQWTVRASADVDPAVIAGPFVVLEWATPGGTYERWQLAITSTDSRLTGYTAAGAASVLFTGGLPFGLAGMSVSAIQTGGNMLLTFRPDTGADQILNTPGTVRPVTSVAVNPTAQTATEQVTVGHVAVYADDAAPPGSTAVYTDAYGYTPTFPAGLCSRWEAAHLRLRRLCAEDGIPLQLCATADTEPDPPIRMDWQPVAKLADLLDDCVDVDGGWLHESRDTLGLVYRTRDSLYTQTPTPIAYVGQLAPPYAPDDDADAVRNDITAGRRDGSSVRVVQTSGPLAAVPPPAGVGVYRTSIPDLSVASDTALPDQAHWRLHHGTVDGERYTAATVHLDSAYWQADPDGMARIASVDSGDVLEVTGRPSFVLGDGRMMVTGYAEEITEQTWKITFAGIPAAPWDTATVDGEPRVAADGTVTTGLTLAGMSMLLSSTPENGPWTTDPADFPLDVRVGAERVRVASIDRSFVDVFGRSVAGGWGAPWAVGAGAPAAFTVDGSQGVIAVSGTNAEYHVTYEVGARTQDVRLWFTLPALPTGAPINAGVLLRYVDANSYVWADAQTATDGSITLRLIKRVSGVATQLATVATSVPHSSTVPRALRAEVSGSLLRARLWASDGAEPAGWDLSVVDPALPDGSRAGAVARLMTGNTNAQPVSVRVDNVSTAQPQLATLSARGINGAAHAWPVGTEVDVWLPAVVAL